MVTERRQTTQNIAWFWDLYRRGLLYLDPPYQRRSVWSSSYKDYFVDTILLAYPAPAIFLFEDIKEDGTTEYSVVDGKQRLTTIFEFLDGVFPVSDAASMSRFRGQYFSDLPGDIKRSFFAYQFTIEFLPSTDEGTLDNIFDRINRNVARLTPQELRHARYSGHFLTVSENLAEFMDAELPNDFPRIAAQSKRQMKDVEFVAQLLLLIEQGVASHSQSDLDFAYSERDVEWDEHQSVEAEFRTVVGVLKIWADGIIAGEARRLRNQADFYSLFGAVLELQREKQLPSVEDAVARLDLFMRTVGSETERPRNSDAMRYYEAARSASNDVAQRRDRVAILKRVLSSEASGGRS